MKEFFEGIETPYSLNNYELKELFKEMSLGSKEAREIIINHNIRLVYSTVNKKFQNVFYDKKELVSIGIMGLIKAVDTFDLSKGKEFSTYATRCVSNEILMFLRKLKKDDKLISFEKIIYESEEDDITLGQMLSNGEDLYLDYEKKYLYDALKKEVKKLPLRNKRIVILYYGLFNNPRYSQKQLASIFGITQSYVSRILRASLKKN